MHSALNLKKLNFFSRAPIHCKGAKMAQLNLAMDRLETAGASSYNFVYVMRVTY